MTPAGELATFARLAAVAISRFRHFYASYAQYRGSGQQHRKWQPFHFRRNVKRLTESRSDSQDQAAGNSNSFPLRVQFGDGDLE